MGEIADAMLDGDLCQYCGVYLGDGDGYPRPCSSCSSGMEEEAYNLPVKKTVRKTVYTAQCDICQRYVKPKGLEMHRRQVHGRRLKG